MLATQMPDSSQETKNVKQIKERLAQSLKALQKKYVTSDEVVTSEDGDANLLCCALEAIFIHGIKSKYIRSEGGGRSRKGDRALLPQPFFWNLLKTVTHSDVITELEKIDFVSTDVGRCRAWLRLALNHGLLECYLSSLFREDSKLRAYYQPGAFLLNTEEREVLLSYLQGLGSLTFNLSYKSAVLKEWTTTPLAFAGLCPMSQVDVLYQSFNGDSHAKSTRRESWDTTSQSSGSSDLLDTQRACPAPMERESDVSPKEIAPRTSSDVSLSTTGSSQLSSSLSSDSLLQGQDPHSLTGEQSSPGDPDPLVHVSTRRKQKDPSHNNRQIRLCSQDSTLEDFFVSSTGVDQLSESAAFSGSDGEAQVPTAPRLNAPEHLPELTSACDEAPDKSSPHKTRNDATAEAHRDPQEPEKPVGGVESGHVTDTQTERKQTDISDEITTKPQEGKSSHLNSVSSRKQSSESLSHSRSWISEDDIYKPRLEEVADSEDLSPSVSEPEPELSQSPPSVVHRRQIGLSNPFRGLLRLGHLERKGAVGMWRDYYCELSPFEFRLYVNAEERTCSENCSLLRCEDARVTSPDGRFELAFPGKRLYLRAANRGEAEDWVDSIVEAVNKCRPAPRADEQWEVLQPLGENGVDECSAATPSSSPRKPKRVPSPSSHEQKPVPPSQEFDWTRTADLETDAIKEAILYFSTDASARTWTPMIFSLSLEALKGFHEHQGKKSCRLSYPVHEIRDVVPDVSLGGPAFFKLLTVKETMRFRAETPEEARSWRDLIRGALDSFLESGEDGLSDDSTTTWNSGVSGNLHRLVQHRLKEDGALLPHLYKVPSEKGLDSQSFKCADCPQPIGPTVGKARLCEYSGQYYCDSCHSRDTSIIPSRMVHNWDLTQREVSRRALRVLTLTQHEPLLNLQQLNPELVKHSETMTQIHSTRKRLRLLGDYLLTCRSGACKNLQARMGQRTYALESHHLYSVKDLRQIAEGEYSNFLLPLVHHAATHIFNCDLCSQRGFICQICHSSDVIFPFQFESTTRCKDCKAVFHKACKTPGLPCPRCERIKKYVERNLQD